MPTVLIIDDSVTNRTLYSKLAVTVQAGLRIVALGRPTEALAWLHEQRADLIITDFKMPELDGAELTRRIRQKGVDADTPIIVVTAYADRSFRMKALEAGATDFLLSPVDHFEFVTRARNLLRLSHQQHLLHRRAEGLLEDLKTSQRQQEIILRDSSDKLAQVIDTVPALISAADRNGNFVFVNESQAQFLSATTESLTGRCIRDVVGRRMAENSLALDQIVFESGTSMPGHEHEMTDPHGAVRTFFTTRAPLRNTGGEVLSVLTTSIDITERKAAEQRLRHLAHHDPLTNLPNRTLIRDKLRRAVSQCRREGGQFALHLIDLDRFKAVNDGLGHHVGDQALIAVGHRLREIVRDTDTVARLGGDEFAILQRDLGGPDDATRLATRITESLAQQFFCAGHQISIGASVGIALHPQDGADADELLRRSDLAMYKAKGAERGTWQLFFADMDQSAREAVKIQVDLRLGLAKGEFVLHYQPQIDLATQQIVGVEALLRWRRPGYGLLKPNAFLRIAEETGAIVAISAWVLREACRQAVYWRDLHSSPLRMAVNLSAVQLRKQNLTGLVKEVLDATQMSPGMLELELTEGMLIEETTNTVKVLQELRDIGVRLAVDDFGTGYSSLSYIKSFPINLLKIDQSFTRGLGTSSNDAAIVRTILELAKSLGLSVIAEGVETAQQMHHLLVAGCDEAQGFYFSEPLDAEGLTELLDRGTVWSRVGVA